MSLENSIDALRAAVEALTARIGAIGVQPIVSGSISVPAAPPAAPPMAAAPPAAPPMPAAPAFLAPPVPVPVAIPFADTTGLTQYLTDAYRSMGSAKGAAIQQVLTQHGYGAVNEVQPHHYASIHAAVESLRAS
ncbi:hypothetical protein KGP36_03965 [Patescibacteria group bacterium]|nr:hypothetical protein [Patescibacteria group bacterium]